jgi:small subunit ribosomal protein S16
MVVIRLSRGGRKKNPFYSIVVADSKKPRDGKFLEKLGYFNPSINDKNKRVFFINSDRMKHWESKGAQSSPTVKRLLKNYHPN